jgi:hypothetical protein
LWLAIRLQLPLRGLLCVRLARVVSLLRFRWQRPGPQERRLLWLALLRLSLVHYGSLQVGQLWLATLRLGALGLALLRLALRQPALEALRERRRTG